MALQRLAALDSRGVSSPGTRDGVVTIPAGWKYLDTFDIEEFSQSEKSRCKLSFAHVGDKITVRFVNEGSAGLFQAGVWWDIIVWLRFDDGKPPTVFK